MDASNKKEEQHEWFLKLTHKPFNANPQLDFCVNMLFLVYNMNRKLTGLECLKELGSSDRLLLGINSCLIGNNEETTVYQYQKDNQGMNSPKTQRKAQLPSLMNTASRLWFVDIIRVLV